MDREEVSYKVGYWGFWIVLLSVLCYYKPNLMWAIFTGFFEFIGWAFRLSFGMLALVWGMFS